MFRALVTTVAIIGVMPALVAGPAAGQPELTFTKPDALALALPSGDWHTVWLRSVGAGGQKIVWRLLVDKGDPQPLTVPETGAAGTANGPVLEVRGKQGIDPNAFGEYQVRVSGLSADGVKGAQLVASVPGAAAASLDTSISAKNDVTPTLNEVLLIPLGVAVLLLFIRGLTLSDGFGGAVGTLDLDFSKSVATTLTAIGALLGTILATGLLKDTTSGISKSGFQALNLTFGVLVVVAPVTYAVFQRKVNVGGTEHYRGKAWALLLASAVTLWAVLGQVWTVYLLLGQLDAAGEITSTAITIMQAAVGIGALLAVIYVWRQVGWIVEKAANRAAPPAAGFMPAGEPADLPSWTPL